MRLAFTIIFNGLRHLEHNHFAENMCKMFDMWVIVEGAALPNGSTDWCDIIPESMISQGGCSTDGTAERLNAIWTENANVEYVKPPIGQKYWDSKDAMVNTAINVLTSSYDMFHVKPMFLWQVDCDEQWKLEDIESAEKRLLTSGATTGCFHSNYYVGKKILASGYWGEGRCDTDELKNAYRRLWVWNGQRFDRHEPPTLEGGNGEEVLLPERFDHYAYYFDDDIKFKEMYYKYPDLYKKWLALQKETVFPQPLKRLISGGWASTDTKLIRKK